jgi:hypothetical protein
MISISKTVQSKLDNIGSVLSPEESELVLPYVVQKFINQGKIEGKAEGIEKGIIYTIRKYILRFPHTTDQEVADLFEVDIQIVQKARSAEA